MLWQSGHFNWTLKDILNLRVEYIYGSRYPYLLSLTSLWSIYRLTKLKLCPRKILSPPYLWCWAFPSLSLTWGGSSLTSSLTAQPGRQEVVPLNRWVSHDYHTMMFCGLSQIGHNGTELLKCWYGNTTEMSGSSLLHCIIMYVVKNILMKLKSQL